MSCEVVRLFCNSIKKTDLLSVKITRLLKVCLTKKVYIWITITCYLWILFYYYRQKEQSGFIGRMVEIPWANKSTRMNNISRAEESGRNDGILNLGPNPLLKYGYYSAPLYTTAATLYLDAIRNCSAVANKVVGRILPSKYAPTWHELETKFVTWNNALLEEALKIKIPPPENIMSLGPWRPIACRPNETVAIILPYRNRDLHLRTFLYHMHGFLRHQEVTYTIFVIEQLNKTHFNRGMLLNIGFRESRRVSNFDCFVFHDVDLLPEDDRIPFRCGDQPIHLCASLDKFNYSLLYGSLFGGATALTRTQFENVRGYSNFFFGWGGEDDDFSDRVRGKGYRLFRYPPNSSRYTSLRHEREQLNKPNPLRWKMLKLLKGQSKLDGYPESDYKVVNAGYRHKGLVYWISAEIPEEKIMKKFNQSQVRKT